MPPHTKVSPRPRDAATLILLRNGAGSQPLVRSTKVLMGQRATRDAWSKLYVFPGGTVDRGDHRIPLASDLKPEVQRKLELACSPARARALATAAIRETFEETGLMLGGRVESVAYPQSADSHWQPFAERSLAPDLGDLEFLCRAITPPFRPKRFNARFFLANADHVDDELAGSGELLNLNWYTLEETKTLPLPKITETVLAVLEQRLATGTLATSRSTPLFRTVRGKHLMLSE